MKPRRLVMAIALALALQAAAAAPSGASGELTYAEVVDLAAEGFTPGVARYAARIAVCESTLVPAARAAGWDRRYGFYEYVGLWQVDPQLHSWRARRIFGQWRSLYDPYVNALVAGDVWREQGWGAWPYCSRWAAR